MEQCTMKNFRAVHRVLSANTVYPYIIDDFNPDKPTRNFGKELLGNDAIKVLMPNKGSVFVYVPISQTMYHGHSAVLPKYRGKMAFRACRKTINWLFENTNCEVIMGFTPTTHKAAIRFHGLLGFKKIGILKGSFLKNGELHDQVIVSLNKGEIKWE